MNADILTAIVLLFGAACYFLLGGRLIAGRRSMGSLPIGLIFFLMAVWVLGGAVELLATSLTVFSVGRSGHFVATALLPVVAYVCFREYTGQSTPVRTVLMLTIVPVVSITLAVPGMILGETALSFLGLGLQAPAIS